MWKSWIVIACYCWLCEDISAKKSEKKLWGQSVKINFFLTTITNQVSKQQSHAMKIKKSIRKFYAHMMTVTHLSLRSTSKFEMKNSLRQNMSLVLDCKTNVYSDKRSSRHSKSWLKHERRQLCCSEGIKFQNAVEFLNQ